ncbi:MAG: polyprenyl synthetase family protein [Ruminococcaceae bacterium]|nr:polyprenyl synthetase family protein [Oscillospiraceae bacterium]
MNNSEFNAINQSNIEIINSELDAILSKYKGNGYDGLIEAMGYSLLSGGKRIRPILVLEFCRACGGDVKLALSAACAVEMLHTYSLIHDDLPCMDNDELRRGMPTNHIKFGESVAVLAGDALQAEAFTAILSSSLPTERRARCSEILATAAGVNGICGGQYIDVMNENTDVDLNTIKSLQEKKTGSLIAAACMMGAAAAGAGETAISKAERFGHALGAAFQIRDDMLDEIGTKTLLGKNVGSDIKSDKATFMSMLGEEKCSEMVLSLTNTAKEEISDFENTEFLFLLADFLVNRHN